MNITRFGLGYFSYFYHLISTVLKKDPYYLTDQSRHWGDIDNQRHPNHPPSQFRTLTSIIILLISIKKYLGCIHNQSLYYQHLHDK